jgi:hypothetical protein
MRSGCFSDERAKGAPVHTNVVIGAIVGVMVIAVVAVTSIAAGAPSGLAVAGIASGTFGPLVVERLLKWLDHRFGR